MATQLENVAQPGTPEPPKKKNWFLRHKFLTAGMAVAAIAIASQATGGGGETASTNTTTPAAQGSAPAEQPAAEAPAEAPAEEAPAETGIGTPVRDGKFEFVVNSVAPGGTTIGDKYLNTTAQGEFVFVNVTVSNIGDEAQFMFADNQYAFDAAGKEFSADSEAGIYLDEAQAALWEEINPGNSVTGTIVFDVPVGTALDKLELHDSAFSGGVTVALS